LCVCGVLASIVYLISTSNYVGMNILHQKCILESISLRFRLPFVSSYEIYFASILWLYIDMPYYMNFEVGAKSTQTLVAKMLMFLRVFPF
jgi:hypothetical protein